MSKQSGSVKGLGTVIKAGAGLALALLLPAGIGSVTAFSLSPSTTSVHAGAPVDIPGLLAKLPPPVIPLPARSTDKLFEVLIPAKVIPRAQISFPTPTNQTPTTQKTGGSPQQPSAPQSPSPTITPPSPSAAYVLQSQQQLSLVPGATEVGYLTIGEYGNADIQNLSMGITGNIGNLGDVQVTVETCTGVPWRSISQAEGSCSQMATSPTSTLSSMEQGALIVPIAGLDANNPVVARVVFHMPTSAGNSQESQHVDFSEIVGLYQ